MKKNKTCPHCGRTLEQIVEETVRAVLGVICYACGWQEKY